MKVDELDGWLLSYWVAKAGGMEIQLYAEPRTPGTYECYVNRRIGRNARWQLYAPHYRWKDAGPIFDRSGRIVLGGMKDMDVDRSRSYFAEYFPQDKPDGPPVVAYGHRPCIALSRVVVKVKFGEVVSDKPDPAHVQKGPPPHFKDPSGMTL